MLKIIADPDRLQRCQNQFLAELNKVRTSIIPCSINWRPDHLDVNVAWSSNFNIWWYSQPMAGSKHQDELPNRWWNVFGTGKPLIHEGVHIQCEINPPMSGINRKVAGGFAEDEKNRLFVIHRGNKWGGGKVGINKRFFWDNYRGPADYMQDGEQHNKVAKIAELGNYELPSEIATFVHWVSKIKSG